MKELAITAIVHRDLCFRDRKGDEMFHRSRSRQRIPMAVATHPYFLAAVASDWVTDVQVLDAETGEEVMLFTEYPPAEEAATETAHVEARTERPHRVHGPDAAHARKAG